MGEKRRKHGKRKAYKKNKRYGTTRKEIKQANRRELKENKGIEGNEKGDPNIAWKGEWMKGKIKCD